MVADVTQALPLIAGALHRSLVRLDIALHWVHCTRPPNVKNVVIYSLLFCNTLVNRKEFRCYVLLLFGL